MVSLIVSSIVTQWIWSMTWAIYQAPYNFIFMLILFYFWEGASFKISFFFSLLANVVAFLTFNILCGVMIYYTASNWISPTAMYEVHHPNRYALGLAFIYAFIQGILLMLIGPRFGLHQGRSWIILVAANLASAALIYKFTPPL